MPRHTILEAALNFGGSKALREVCCGNSVSACETGSSRDSCSGRRPPGGRSLSERRHRSRAPQGQCRRDSAESATAHTGGTGTNEHSTRQTRLEATLRGCLLRQPGKRNNSLLSPPRLLAARYRGAIERLKGNPDDGLRSCAPISSPRYLPPRRVLPSGQLERSLLGGLE